MPTAYLTLQAWLPLPKYLSYCQLVWLQVNWDYIIILIKVKQKLLHVVQWSIAHNGKVVDFLASASCHKETEAVLLCQKEGI